MYARVKNTQKNMFSSIRESLKLSALLQHFLAEMANYSFHQYIAPALGLFVILGCAFFAQEFMAR